MNVIWTKIKILTECFLANLFDYYYKKCCKRYEIVLIIEDNIYYDHINHITCLIYEFNFRN